MPKPVGTSLPAATAHSFSYSPLFFLPFPVPLYLGTSKGQTRDGSVAMENPDTISDHSYDRAGTVRQYCTLLNPWERVHHF